MSVPHEDARLIRIASRRYRVPANVIAGMIEVESGFNPGAVSPAGAFGETQFMPGTATSYGVKRGSGHHAKATQILGGAKYLRDLSKGKGLRWALAAYNGGPGNPQFGYADKVLAASKKYKGLGKDSSSRPRANSTSTVTTRTPGTDNSALRQGLKLDYLAHDYDPNALLNLAQGLQGAADVPGSVRTTTRTNGTNARGAVAGNGVPINDMLRRAHAWERAKVPYLWGGGHGSIAKPGDKVDCSGFVSAVLGLKTPLVSGDLAKWGNPGPGRHVTVFASATHTFIRIGNKWFGTSASNPGGGAGRISPPSASYLSGFTQRHP